MYLFNRLLWLFYIYNTQQFLSILCDRCNLIMESLIITDVSRRRIACKRSYLEHKDYRLAIRGSRTFHWFKQIPLVNLIGQSQSRAWKNKKRKRATITKENKSRNRKVSRWSNRSIDAQHSCKFCVHFDILYFIMYCVLG